MRRAVLTLLLLCFIAGGVLMVSAGGWRHFVLIPFGRTARGFVTHVDQPPPWRIREADYEIKYMFYDASGRRWTGSDVVPPVVRPYLAQQISIRYWPRRPGVNRVASEVTTTPVVGVVVCLVGVFRVAALLRQRPPETPQSGEVGVNRSDQ